MPLIAPGTAASQNPPSRRKASPGVAMKALEEGTDFGRRQAALDLADVAEAIPALLARLEVEQDGAVREAILLTLTATGTPEIVDVLIAQLRAEDAARRSEAVIALQHLSAAVAERVDGLLNDPDPDMRIMMVDVLRLLPHADAPRWLRAVLEHETHENVIGNAIDRMAEIGGPDDLPALRAARDRFAAVPYIRFAADMVITRIETLTREADA